MCTGQECKDQFTCKSLGLEYDRPTEFGLSQFGKKSLAYVIFRFICGSFFAVSFFYGFGSYDADPWWKWLIFLTHWGMAVLTTAALLGAVVSLHVYLRGGDGADKNNYKMPVGYKIYWVFNNMNLSLAPLISIIYWVTVYDPDINKLNFPSITFHVVNLAWTILDFIFSAVPVRVLHILHPFCFGVVYMLFTIIYWQAGGTNEQGKPYIYSIVDYEEPTTATVGVIALYVLVMGFLLMWFGLYRLRLLIYRSCGCAQVAPMTPTNDRNNPI